MTTYFQKSLFYPIIYAFCLVVIFRSEALSMEREQDYLRAGSQRPTVQVMVTSNILKKTTKQDWKDNNGNRAPAAFRKAADKLWNSVDAEAKFEWGHGYGIYKKHPVTCNRICCDILCCFLPECCSCINPNLNKIGTYGLHNMSASPDNWQIVNIQQAQKKEEVQHSFNDFKDTLNQSVKNPEHYIGDINIWTNNSIRVEDGAWNYLDGCLVSARRDLINLYEETLSFVNSHGGWTEQPNPFSAVNARMVGDTIVMGGM